LTLFPAFLKKSNESIGSWPTDGTLTDGDPGCDDCGKNLTGCNRTAMLPADFREKLWKGLPSVAFPKVEAEW